MNKSPNPDAVLQYVRASALLLSLSLDDVQVERVAGHLARTAGLARLLEAVPLSEDDEPAEVYRPAPFPAPPDPPTA